VRVKKRVFWSLGTLVADYGPRISCPNSIRRATLPDLISDRTPAGSAAFCGTYAAARSGIVRKVFRLSVEVAVGVLAPGGSLIASTLSDAFYNSRAKKIAGELNFATSVAYNGADISCRV